MPLVYHLVVPSAWGQFPAEPYRAGSLADEGFIHCSFADQVVRSANRFYPDAPELFLLHVDPERLTSPLRVEPSGSGERFPHVYGPINRSAVVAVQALVRDGSGHWTFPAVDSGKQAD